jgi:SEC-C motif
MTTAGRDDPCPCGGGRKYKDCCGARKEVQQLAAVYSATIRESSLSKLLAYAFQPIFDGDHSVAETVFWGRLLRDAAPQEVQWLMDSEDANIKYNSWFLFDWDIDGQGTAAELFLQDAQGRLTPAERQFLARLVRAHLRLYEVEAVDRGHGVHLLDLWIGERIFVIERTATARIVTWDLLGGRVAPDGLGGKVFEGGLYLYPAEAKTQMVAEFRRLFRRHKRKCPKDDDGAFFKKHGMVFHHLWLDLVAFPKAPDIVTDEGEPLMFCRAVFDADNVNAVRDQITAQPDVRPVEEGRFAWLESGAREVGAWGFEGQRVVFETTSRERAARGRAWLEALCGDHVRYRATALETLQQTIDALRRRPAKPIEPSPQEDSEAVRVLYDRRFSNWLDRPDTGLGNRTPRAAAQSKLWRPHVIERLKLLENDTERAALNGRPTYDFEWIWKELDIQRPGSE